MAQKKIIEVVVDPRAVKRRGRITLPAAVYEALADLAAAKLTSISGEATSLLKEGLGRLSMWPPANEGQDREGCSLAGIAKNLNLKMSLDSVAFARGLSKTVGAVTGFGKNLVKTVSDAATGLAVFGLAVDGFKQVVNLVGSVFGDQIAEVDRLSKSARRLGMSNVDSLVGIEHAATLAGVSTEDLAGGMGLLSRKLGMIQATPDLGKGWAKWGLDVEKLVDMDAGAAFAEVADKINALGSANEKAAAAYTVFGKKGQSVLALLLEGRGSIAAAVKEAERLGLTFGGANGLMIEELADNLDRVSAAWNGFRRQVLMLFAPAIDGALRFAIDALVGLRQKALPVFSWLKEFGVGVWLAIAKAWATWGQPLFEQAVAWIDSFGAAFPEAKGSALNAVEALVQGVNYLINAIKQMAGVVYRDFQVPFTAAVAEVAAAVSQLLLHFSGLSVAMGGKSYGRSAAALDNLAKKMREVNKLQMQFGVQLLNTPLDANKDAIAGFFNDIRQQAAADAGMKNAWGWLLGGAKAKGGAGSGFGADLGGGLKEAKVQFSAAMEMGSKEAFSAIAQHKFGGMGLQRDVAKDHLGEAKRLNQKMDKLINVVDNLGGGEPDELLDLGFGVP